MSYYHVYIDMDGEEVQENDLSLEDLTKHITEPYNRGIMFLCKGMKVYPSEVTTIRIVETETPAADIISDQRTRRGIFALFGLDEEIEILEKAGKDVTRKFLSTSLRGRTPFQKGPKAAPSRNVFIVHGRDFAPVEELKKMLTKWGLNPIVLNELASGGSSTLPEKLDKYAKNVGYAFVILTPDDVGCEKTELERILGLEGSLWSRDVLFTRIDIKRNMQGLSPRARQNVIFEMGLFWGLLDRKRVCCLRKGEVEKPSDIEGIVYVPFKESVNEVKNAIERELREAKYKIRD